jgi:hypothetical protein
MRTSASRYSFGFQPKPLEVTVLKRALARQVKHIRTQSQNLSATKVTSLSVSSDITAFAQTPRASPSEISSSALN